MNVLWVGVDAMARPQEHPGLSHGDCDLSWRTTSLMAWAGALQVIWRPEGQISPHLCLPYQVPTPVSTQASASTHWAPLSASVYRATQGPAVRLMSMSASPTRVRMMPPAWTRSGSSSVYVCQVRLCRLPPWGLPRAGSGRLSQGWIASSKTSVKVGSLWQTEARLTGPSRECAQSWADRPRVDIGVNSSGLAY